MADKENRGPGALKDNLEKRLDANATMEKQHFSGRSSKDPAKGNKAAADGTHSLAHGEKQRSAPNSPRHGG